VSQDGQGALGSGWGTAMSKPLGISMTAVIRFGASDSAREHSTGTALIQPLNRQNPMRKAGSPQKANDIRSDLKMRTLGSTQPAW
jgi:hypothetical protein